MPQVEAFLSHVTVEIILSNVSGISIRKGQIRHKCAGSQAEGFQQRRSCKVCASAGVPERLFWAVGGETGGAKTGAILCLPNAYSSYLINFLLLTASCTRRRLQHTENWSVIYPSRIYDHRLAFTICSPVVPVT